MPDPGQPGIGPGHAALRPDTYLFVTWRIRAGLHARFEEAWHGIAAAISRVPGVQPTHSLLMRNIDQAGTYEALHRVPDMEALEVVRSRPEVRAATREAEAHCNGLEPRTCVVAAFTAGAAAAEA